MADGGEAGGEYTADAESGSAYTGNGAENGVSEGICAVVEIVAGGAYAAGLETVDENVSPGGW